jgi:hypothetical protein
VTVWRKHVTERRGAIRCRRERPSTEPKGERIYDAGALCSRSDPRSWCRCGDLWFRFVFEGRRTVSGYASEPDCAAACWFRRGCLQPRRCSSSGGSLLAERLADCRDPPRRWGHGDDQARWLNSGEARLVARRGWQARRQGSPARQVRAAVACPCTRGLRSPGLPADWTDISDRRLLAGRWKGRARPSHLRREGHEGQAESELNLASGSAAVAGRDSDVPKLHGGKTRAGACAPSGAATD